MRTVAALYVEADGPYSGLDGVDCWPRAGTRGSTAARIRWWRTHLATAGLRSLPSLRLCMDISAETTADASRLRWQQFGYMEAFLSTPPTLGAWRWFGMCQPPSGGGWVNADWEGGWTCYVEQGHYGHRARKATWLYSAGCELPSLKWGSCGITEAAIRVSGGRRRPTKSEPSRPVIERHPGESITSAKDRIETPGPFRDLLLSMARSVPC